MADLSQLVGGHDRGSGGLPSAMRGLVAKTPPSSGDILYVVATGFSGEYHFEVPGSQWMTNDGAMPQQGDRCLIIIDDVGDAWVPVWSAR